MYKEVPKRICKFYTHAGPAPCLLLLYIQEWWTIWFYTCQKYELLMFVFLLPTCMVAEALKACEVVRVVAFDIRGTFGRVWWSGFLTHLHSIYCYQRMGFRCYKKLPYTDNSFIVVINGEESDLCQTCSCVKEEYGHCYVLTFLSMASLRKLDMQQCSVLLMIYITLVYNT